MNQPSITTINKINNIEGNTSIFSGTDLTADDFDINKFNIQFEQKQREQQLKQKRIVSTEEKEIKLLHQYTFGELFKDYITSLINIIDELVLFRYNNFNDFINIFTKNNRLLYIGITIILLAICAFLFRNQ